MDFLHEVDVADHIWKTCYALLNMMLHVYGFTEEWYGELVLFDLEDINNLSFALQRLTSFTELKNTIHLAWVMELQLMMKT